MELRHLHYLFAVVKEGQITRAAHRVGVEPPLSRAINDLEKEIGAPLVERTRARLQTTPAGQTLADHASDDSWLAPAPRSRKPLFT